MIKSLPYAMYNSLFAKEVMLLIAHLMMIRINESINKDLISMGYIIVKAAGCLGNYAANNPRPRGNALGLGLFEQNFLATML